MSKPATIGTILESQILHQILQRWNIGGAVRLLRNNSGAWKDKTGRWIRYGLGAGSSDLIGWKSVVVTQEMVGRKIAVFCGLEIKRPGAGADGKQLEFIARVNDAGGCAGIAHSIEEAGEILRGASEGWIQRRGLGTPPDGIAHVG